MKKSSTEDLGGKQDPPDMDPEMKDAIVKALPAIKKLLQQK